jgi:WD40 repeat protein
MLKLKILEQKDKLFYTIAKDYATPNAEYDRIFIKGHKNAITDLVWTPDNQRVITSSKDCNLIMWDIESQKKMFFKGEKFNRTMQGHFDEVLTCAISPNGKYLVSGGKDRIVRIWDLHNQKQI